MSYPDRWAEAVAAKEVFAVYVPRPGAWDLSLLIAPGSGIVGRTTVNVPLGRDPLTGKIKALHESRSEQIEICFEGNLHGAVNLQTYAERVDCAGGRLVTGYPTIARAWVDESELQEVGVWGPGVGLRITNQSALDAWVATS